MAGAGVHAALTNDRHVFVEPVGDAVDLTQQYGGGIDRIAGSVDRCFNGTNGGVIHHLERGGYDTGGHDAGHGARGGIDAWEIGEQRVHHVGQWHESHRDLGGDTEASLTANEQAQQVVAVRFTERVAQLRARAVGEHHVAGHHVV